MDIQRIDAQLSITAQPQPDELEELSAKGFGTVLSNRPRGESEDQPDPGRLKAKAESLGMVWQEVPVKPGEYSQADIEAFQRVLAGSPTPVIGFCRSGKRVVHLWALSQAGHRPVQELIETASAAGYDLEPMRESLEDQANRASSKP